MNPPPRKLLATLVAIAIGIGFTKSYSWVIGADVFSLGSVFPTQWQQSINALLLVVLLCLPIGALSHGYAPLFGLLAYCSSELLLLIYAFEFDPVLTYYFSIWYRFPLDASMFCLASFAWGKFFATRAQTKPVGRNA